MKLLIWGLLACALALPVAAHAARDDDKGKDATEVEAVQTADDFADLRKQIDREMRTSKRYKELTEDDFHAVHEQLDIMEDILAGVDSVDQLDAEQRAALFNAQERANLLLTGAREDSRMECRREARVGSRLASTTCHTVAEWRRQGEDARSELQRRARGVRGDI